MWLLSGLLAVVVFAMVKAEEVPGSSVSDASTVAVEVRSLAAGLAAYPQHAEDVEELHSILEEFEQTSVKVAAVESGVQERGFGLSSSRINEQISVQSARTDQMYQRLQAKRWEANQQVADQSIEEAKAHYEESKEQFKSALRILREHMDRQSQAVQKITQ